MMTLAKEKFGQKCRAILESRWGAVNCSEFMG